MLVCNGILKLIPDQGLCFCPKVQAYIAVSDSNRISFYKVTHIEQSSLQFIKLQCVSKLKNTQSKVQIKKRVVLYNTLQFCTIRACECRQVGEGTMKIFI